MARLVSQQITRAGIAPGFAAATAGGDTLANDTGTEVLHVKNASAGAINVTVVAVTTCSQGGSHNAVVAVPANSERKIGPFPRDQFGSEPAVNYSAVASVTVGAFRA